MLMFDKIFNSENIFADITGIGIFLIRKKTFESLLKVLWLSKVFINLLLTLIGSF